MTGEPKEYTLKPEFLQVQSLNSFASNVSASRADMFASEIGQAPPLQNAEVKLIQTGMEREYGKYTHKVKMPCNGIVKQVVHQYPPTGMVHSQIPTSIIYQDMDYSEGGARTPRFGVAHLPLFSLNHHVLGFDFKRTNATKGLREGIAIREGTILAQSPSVDENGDYRYGVNANVLLGSFPEVRQDGVVIRRGFAEKTKFKGYGEMVISFGEDEVPLNLYGDDENYKIHPDVGELIRPDGVLFASRKLITGLYPIQMSRKALRTPTRTDKRKIAKEEGARVVSVEVIYSPRGKPSTPSGMAEQPNKYLEAQRRYYRELRGAYEKIRHEHGNAVSLDPALHNLLVRAEAMLHDTGRDRQRVSFVDAGQPLSEYTIKITYSYDLFPFDGHKTADQNGKTMLV